MTGGQCVSDVCPKFYSALVSQVLVVSVVVQRWWAVTPIRPGMIGMRSLVELQWNPKTENGIQRPYRPPPGLLGLIYRLSSGQEIPHFPSLGPFCNGKLHHLPNLWNIFMGKCSQTCEKNSSKFNYLGLRSSQQAENLIFFTLLRFDSVWFRQFEKWVIVYYTVIKILSWMGRAHSVLSMMIYSSTEDQWQFIFHWIHVSLISPLWPPTSSDNACQTKLQHNPYPFTFKLLAIKALNINGPV